MMDPVIGWWVTALGCGGLFAITLMLHARDARLIGREGVWVKPMKFAASLSVHFATLALIASLLPVEVRGGLVLQAVAVASILATIFELSYILRQASLGQASHFNVASPYHRTMYFLMALGAVVIVVAAGVLGVEVHTSGAVGRVLSLSILHGLVGGAVLTLLTAFHIGSRRARHVGSEAAQAARMRFTGWSLEVGDLRVAHFLATHMMQVLPLLGLLLTRFADEAMGESLVWLASGLWMSWTMAEFRRALAGRPMLMARFAPGG